MKYFIYEDGGTVESEAVLQGMSLTGFLKINKDPFVSNEAVNKEYVDGLSKELPSGGVTTGIMSERRFPDMEGELTSNAGSGLISLSDTGVLTGTYPKVSVNKGGVAVGGENLQAGDIPSLSWSKLGVGSIPNTLSGYGITNAVNKNTGTLLGTLRTTVHPLLPNDAVTKTYLDNKVSTVVGYNVGDVITGEWDTTPEGFLQCNGGEVEKDLYPILYSVIGDKYSITGHAITAGAPWEQQYMFNDRKNKLDQWNYSAPSIYGVNDTVSFCTKNKTYIIGGTTNGGSSGHMQVGDIDSEGMLVNWKTLPNLTYPVTMGRAILIKNHVYIVAIRDSPVVRYAQIQADGSIGPLIDTLNPLPRVLTWASVSVIGKYLYVLGGGWPSSVSNVYRAEISEGGSLGSWSAYQSLPRPISAGSVAVIKNKIYLIGGCEVQGNGINSVYCADIDSEDNIGTWVSQTPLPLGLHLHNIVVTKNKIFLLGGWLTNLVHSVDINEDGTLGTWKQDNPLPVVRATGQVIVTKNFVHLLNGYDAYTRLNTVLSCRFNGGRNDYSDFYNGQHLVKGDPLKFKLPIYAGSTKTLTSNYYIKY